MDASKFVIPAALVPFVAPMVTVAAEGTGRVSHLPAHIDFFPSLAN